MKIGITEKGDAALDMSWVDKLDTVDGAILITKHVTPQFRDAVDRAVRAGHKIIVHATCTGYGRTTVEPNVPDYKEQIYQMTELLDILPKENIVLRIDPVFPTEKGLSTAHRVLSYAFSDSSRSNMRVRMSLVDEYKHVKKRFSEAGFHNVYENGQPSIAQLHGTMELFEMYQSFYMYGKAETCAETMLAQRYPEVFEAIGCVSMRDIGIMNITPNGKMGVNPQQRGGCLCLTCKTELLSQKKRCPHGCVYCYWRD